MKQTSSWLLIMNYIDISNHTCSMFILAYDCSYFRLYYLPLFIYNFCTFNCALEMYTTVMTMTVTYFKRGVEAVKK